ncbi:hypothetical protein [Brachybacterium sacelli]|uniref:Uncharacterized protein n=1 Tax=Brachybacterium sacelli TaxID=173364 RepID=A0ABS4X6M2_9MICO|nr:hypothetical protein [Brachybacterium sacelli]MBP2384001.1 hypothetical protein [Brachybacterium sacelli]
MDTSARLATSATEVPVNPNSASASNAHSMNWLRRARSKNVND